MIMHLIIQWTTIVGIAIVGTYLIKLALDWHAARAIVQARLQEIRDMRIYEYRWKGN